MNFAKKHADGQAERLNLIRKWEPRAERLLEQVLKENFRHSVQPDDVLDALVAWVTLGAPLSELSRLPGTLEFDDQGLPMQMVFRDV